MSRVAKGALGWYEYEGMEGARYFKFQNKVNNETTLTNISPKATCDFF